MKQKCLGCLQAVAVETRFNIFQYLRKLRGKATVSKLVELTGLRQPTVTFHVNALAEAGLVKKTRVGKNVFCRLQEQCADCPLFVS
ncbi:MAG: metalloregulator ArsR/SmtB family transcription factor [Patescibacteria group bacterium]|nr:metalloregulator ArsR/SmtB family transcription factor [Patescibacteria group bacterium]